MGILDTIKDTKHADLLQTFEPTLVVSKILDSLKDREKQILSARFGLNGNSLKTLEVIGKEQGLTRERVRQIEKSLIKLLKSRALTDSHMSVSRDLFSTLISEHGDIMAEEAIFEHLRFENDAESNSVVFILHLLPDISRVEEDAHIKHSWVSTAFNRENFHAFVDHVKEVLSGHGKPMKEDELVEKVKSQDAWKKVFTEFNAKAVLNFLKTAKTVSRNAFGDIGLSNWNEIQPKDVGDKAYLVMKHNGKPLHYTAITELINKHKFDSRQAYKETVHNELIKDKRFILVGRGMYALSEWGYKPGVVSDVIVEVLKDAGKPMSRDEIVAEVLKRRMVKKNTVLVGLSNKKLLKKAGKNLYTLAE